MPKFYVLKIHLDENEVMDSSPNPSPGHIRKVKIDQAKGKKEPEYVATVHVKLAESSKARKDRHSKYDTYGEWPFPDGLTYEEQFSFLNEDLGSLGLVLIKITHMR